MIETLRTIVHPWELDAVDHFTTAFYYRAFSHADLHLLQRLGCDESRMKALEPRSCRTRFLRELRAGDAYHLTSGLVSSTSGSVVLGHKMVNSETGAACATHLQEFAGDLKPREAIGAADWQDEKPLGEVDFDKPRAWSRTGLNVVQKDDLDYAGRMGLMTLIHFASDANVQFQNMIGMTSSYMHEKHIGYATMAYEITLIALPEKAGTFVETESALAHMGCSSLWFAHRVQEADTKAPIAHIAQFGVHFDRVARKAAEIPSHIREAAERHPEVRA
jgi:acyl-CoA thioesterase FadM